MLPKILNDRLQARITGCDIAKSKQSLHYPLCFCIASKAFAVVTIRDTLLISWRTETRLKQSVVTIFLFSFEY